MLTGCSDAHQVIAVHLDQALLCPCLKFNKLQIRQAASGWISVRAFILSSGIPCISVLDTTCVKIKIALSPLEAQNSEHICPALRDMHLIYLSVTLVYISGEKNKLSKTAAELLPWNTSESLIMCDQFIVIAFCALISNRVRRAINVMPPIQIALTGMPLGERDVNCTPDCLWWTYVTVCQMNVWEGFVLWLLSILSAAEIESDEAWRYSCIYWVLMFIMDIRWCRIRKIWQMADLKLWKKLYGNDDRIYTYTVYVACGFLQSRFNRLLTKQTTTNVFYFFSQVWFILNF